MSNGDLAFDPDSPDGNILADYTGVSLLALGHGFSR
jgi:hypothetical protein